MMRSSSSRELCCVETIHATSGSRPTDGQSMPINSTHRTPRNVLPARRSLNSSATACGCGRCSRNASTRSAAQRAVSICDSMRSTTTGCAARTRFPFTSLRQSLRCASQTPPASASTSACRVAVYPSPRSVRPAPALALAPTTSLVTGWEPSSATSPATHARPVASNSRSPSGTTGDKVRRRHTIATSR